MVSIRDLPDNEIQIYLDRNERVLLRVVRENDVSAMHANHVVLMSVVARRVSLTTGVPYAVMPAGSEICRKATAEMRTVVRPNFDTLYSTAWLDLVERLDAPTPYVWIIGRTQTNGVQDYEAVHKVSIPSPSRCGRLIKCR